MKKIMLLCSTRLSNSGVGSLFLKDAISNLEDFQFLECCHVPFEGVLNKNSLLGRGARYLLMVLQRLRIFNIGRYYFFKRFVLVSKVKLLLERMKEEDVDSVWLVASSVELILIASRLSDAGLKLRLMVWDSPEYLIDNSKLTSWKSVEVMNAFQNALTSARSVAVISQNMRSAYLHKYGVDAIVIRHGIDVAAPYSVKKNLDEVNIIFAGSLYAKKEWNSFIAALTNIGWSLLGRKINVFFLGRFPRTGAHCVENVSLLGEVPFSDAMHVMSKMDVGYLPYWFSESHRLAASTAFPSKLSAYAAAGLAIFHHAPGYAEASSFLQKYEFGVNCSSLNCDEIIRCLERLIELMDSEGFRAARDEAFSRELSKRSMAARFYEFISC